MEFKNFAAALIWCRPTPSTPTNPANKCNCLKPTLQILNKWARSFCEKKPKKLRFHCVARNFEKSSPKNSEVIWELTLANFALKLSHEPKKLDNLRWNSGRIHVWKFRFEIVARNLWNWKTAKSVNQNLNNIAKIMQKTTDYPILSSRELILFSEHVNKPKISKNRKNAMRTNL